MQRKEKQKKGINSNILPKLSPWWERGDHQQCIAQTFLNDKNDSDQQQYIAQAFPNDKNNSCDSPDYFANQRKEMQSKAKQRDKQQHIAQTFPMMRMILSKVNKRKEKKSKTKWSRAMYYPNFPKWWERFLHKSWLFCKAKKIKAKQIKANQNKEINTVASNYPNFPKDEYDSCYSFDDFAKDTDHADAERWHLMLIAIIVMMPTWWMP